MSYTPPTASSRSRSASTHPHQAPPPPRISRLRSGSVAALPSSYAPRPAAPTLHKSVSTNNLRNANTAVSPSYVNRSHPNLLATSASHPSSASASPSTSYSPFATPPASTPSTSSPSFTPSASTSTLTSTTSKHESRLHNWISEQCVLAVEDLGISFSSSALVQREEEEQELFSASTYVPVARRGVKADCAPIPNSEGRGDEWVRRGRAASSATATTVQGRGGAPEVVRVGGGGLSRNPEGEADWYWRSPSHSHSPSPSHGPSPHSPGPSPSTSEEFEHIQVLSSSTYQLPSSSSPVYPSSASTYHHPSGTARSDSPLLGFESPPRSPLPPVPPAPSSHGFVEQQGGVTTAPAPDVEEAGGEDGGEEEEEEKVKHRRSKSSEDTYEYDFPRTPGPEEAFFGVGEDPAQASLSNEDEKEPERDPLVFPGRGYKRALPDAVAYSPTSPLNVAKKNTASTARKTSGSSTSTDTTDDAATPMPVPSSLPQSLSPSPASPSQSHASGSPSPVSPSRPPGSPSQRSPTGPLTRVRAPTLQNAHSRQRSGTSFDVRKNTASPSTSPRLGYAAPAFLASPSFRATSPSLGYASTSPRLQASTSPSQSPLLSSYSSMTSLRSAGSPSGSPSARVLGRSRAGSVSALSLDPGANAEKALSRKPSLAKKPSFSALREVCEEDGSDVDGELELERTLDAVDLDEEQELRGGLGQREGGGEARVETRDRSASASTVASFMTAKTDVLSDGGERYGDVFSEDEGEAEGKREMEEEEDKGVKDREEEEEEVAMDTNVEPLLPAAPIIPSSTIETATPKPKPHLSRNRAQSASVVPLVRGAPNAKRQSPLRGSSGVGVEPGGHGHGHGHGYSQSVSYAPTPRRSSGVPEIPVAPNVPGTSAPGLPSRASVGLGLGPGVGVRIQTRSRAGSLALGGAGLSLGAPASVSTPPASAALFTPPGSASLFAPPPSGASLFYSDTYTPGIMTPPGTAGLTTSGLASVSAETPARHAVYIVDGEEVSRRLGELLLGAEMDDGEGDDETREERGQEWHEGKRTTVMQRDLDLGGREEEEGEMADPVLPLSDYFGTRSPPVERESIEEEGDVTMTAVTMGESLAMAMGEEESVLVSTVPNTPPTLPSLSLPPLSFSPSLKPSSDATTSASPSVQNTNSTAGFYGTPYASSSQIYLGPSGGNGSGEGSGGASVHSRGSSASSKKSKSDKELKGKRESARLSVVPSPLALASRRLSRSPRHSTQQLSVSASSLRSPNSDIFQYLNNSPHEHAQSLLPSPTIPISAPVTSNRVSMDGPPPKRPPPAPPLDLGLSMEEVRALRARGIRSPGARVTTFGLGSPGVEGYRMSFGKDVKERMSVGEGGDERMGGEERGNESLSVVGDGAKGDMGGFKFPAAPQAVMSAPVVREERGSYFGVYGRRASPLGTVSVAGGDEEVEAEGHVEEEEEVDEEIEAVQREMAGIIFEKHRRSLSLSSSHISLDPSQPFEAHSHRPMDSSSSPLDPSHPSDVYSHRPMDSRSSPLDPDHPFDTQSHRPVDSSNDTLDPFGYYEEAAYDDSFDVEAELGPDFAREMGLTMGGAEGEGEDTVKGHHPATVTYRTQRPGLSVVVPDRLPPLPQSSFTSTSPAVRSRGPSPLELGPRHNAAPGSTLRANGDVDDASRWSVASSLVLGKQSLDFPSLPVPQPASKRSSDSSKHSKKSSSSSASFFRRSHTKSTPSASSKPSTLQKDDFFDDDSFDGHEMYGLGGGVAGSMVVVPPQPTSSFSPASPEAQPQLQPQSPPKRSLSKWRKRDRGNSVASTALAPTSKSAPASPTKRRSHTVSAKDLTRDQHLVVGTESKEGEQQGQKEGKRGRLASFFSKISKREHEEVPHPPAPWTLSGGQASAPGSSSSGQGSPSLHPARARASTTGATEVEVRGVEGQWEGLAPVGRITPEKESVPPVPALPPLHTLPRMASRGSLRGVAVLNNASQSNVNGPPSSYSPVQAPYSHSPAPYSPVQSYSNSPFGGSPRTSYVPTPVNGSSPRTSYVPSPIIAPHHSAMSSPVNSRRTTMTSSNSNSNLSMGFQPAYSSELDLGFGPDEVMSSVPPTPTSMVSFASSGASSAQVLLRTSRSAGNLLGMASPSLEPASPPPPPVPPKDEDYAPLPPQSQSQGLKSATAGGVYVPGYEWPPSEPLPASAFVPGGGRDEYAPVGRDSREEKKDGVLGRLRLKSSPSLGNLHHAKEVREAREREAGREGKGGLRGFVARIGGRSPEFDEREMRRRKERRIEEGVVLNTTHISTKYTQLPDSHYAAQHTAK